MNYMVHQTKTQLSKLIAQALEGEDVVICKGDQPVVKLAPVKPLPKRQFGALKGKIAITDVFFEPLPEEEAKAWEGG